MIDMRAIFSHSEYENTVNRFKESDCDWSIFQELHKGIANNKCPICEVELVEIPNHPYSATIDHFRPKKSNADKKMYPHLKCEPRNYILMCSLCNNRYKKAEFPLVDESKRATEAKTIEETKSEQPLLFNPAEEKPLYFFELAFRQTEAGNILELKRKKTIHKDSYDYLRCKEMIELFGLGYVHKNIHPDEETKQLRLDVLRLHYDTFIEFATIIMKEDKKSLALFLQNKNRIEMLKKYGFFQFLMKKQFSILNH
jgi:hypothetical protein